MNLCNVEEMTNADLLSMHTNLDNEIDTAQANPNDHGDGLSEKKRTRLKARDELAKRGVVWQ